MVVFVISTNRYLLDKFRAIELRYVRWTNQNHALPTATTGFMIAELSSRLIQYTQGQAARGAAAKQ